MSTTLTRGPVTAAGPDISGSPAGSQPTDQRSTQGAASGADSVPVTDEDRQEIRIAVTMTGGVSLAIWMGGVARELNLLSQASWRRDLPVPREGRGFEVANLLRLYAGLMDELDVSVDIDVLSGTSAGGVNSAVLGFAEANNCDIGKWRDQWITLGSFQNLLRDPKEKDPSALLYGDKWMYAQLATVFPAFDRLPANPRRQDTNVPQTTVFMTTTLLAGEINRFTDSYGTLIQDTDHHGLFTFTHDDLAAAAADTPNAALPLALAARSTASFPGAFEPSFLPFDTPTPASPGVPERPDMKQYTNITRPHWVADGGLLANRPLRPVLETIFDRSANVPVRRVLLYVVPSTGPEPDPRSSLEVDDPAQPLTMQQALVKDLGAVLSQSIASDLAAIATHNSTVDALSDTRLQLADLGARLAGSLRTPGLLDDYRRRESLVLARPVVRAVMQLISTLPPAGAPGQALPASWLALMSSTDIERDCLAAAVAAVSENWTAWPDTADAVADFGRPAWDGAKATVLAMLRAAHQLADEAQRVELRTIRDQVHSAFAGIRPRPNPRKIVDALFAPPAPVPGAPAPAALPGYQQDLPLFAAEAARTYVRELANGVPRLGAAWQQLGRIVDDSSPFLGQLFVGGRPATGSLVNVPAARNQLAIYLRYLFGARGAPAAAPAAEPAFGARGAPAAEPAADAPAGDIGSAAGVSAVTVLLRLFDLHVAQRAISPLTEEVEQPVELVQVSADTRTTLDPARRTATAKLTGMQLQHFGAFYKGSWRANDWLWGRVDGCGWLVHLLLDPRRLLEVASRPANTTEGSRSEWLTGRLCALVGASAADVPAVVSTELAFLDGDGPLPTSVPNTAMWVAGYLQRWIVAQDLPVVAQQMRADVEDGSATWRGDERAWVNGVDDATRKPQGEQLTDLAELFRASPVPAQTFETEIGQPLLARTVTKALATTTGALTAFTADVAALKPLFTSLRGVTLTTYQATKATRATPRALLLAGVALIVVGFVLAAGWGNLLGLGGIGLIAAGLGIVALGVWGLSWRGLKVLLGALLLLLVIAPSLPWVRNWLFAPGPKSPGIVTPALKAFPAWLAASWWHPTVVLGGLLVLVAVISLAVTNARRARKSAR